MASSIPPRTCEDPDYSPQGSLQQATSAVCHPNMPHMWSSMQTQLTVETPGGSSWGLHMCPRWKGRSRSPGGRAKWIFDLARGTEFGKPRSEKRKNEWNTTHIVQHLLLNRFLGILDLLAFVFIHQHYLKKGLHCKDYNLIWKFCI